MEILDSLIITLEMRCFFLILYVLQIIHHFAAIAYPLQVVPGSGHILSNFIFLTLENELKTD